MSIHHTSMHIPHDKLEEEIKFLEAAYAHLGFKVLMRPMPNIVGFGIKGPFYWLITKKRDGTELTDKDFAGEYDRHVAIAVESREQVDEFHKAAVAAGGKDNGAPGPRHYHPKYYGAFVLSPSGINMEAVIMS